MAASRSYYLSSRQDDFAEPEAAAGGVDIIDIHTLCQRTTTREAKIDCRRAAGFYSAVLLPCIASVYRNAIAARHSFHRDGDLFRDDRWVEWIMLGIAEH